MDKALTRQKVNRERSRTTLSIEALIIRITEISEILFPIESVIRVQSNDRLPHCGRVGIHLTGKHQQGFTFQLDIRFSLYTGPA